MKYGKLRIGKLDIDGKKTLVINTVGAVALFLGVDSLEQVIGFVSEWSELIAVISLAALNVLNDQLDKRRGKAGPVPE